MSNSCSTAPVAKPPRFRLITRKAAKRLAVLFAAIALGLAWCWWSMIRMPGRSHTGELSPLTDPQRATADQLRGDVQMLAGTIGQRSTFYPRAFAESAQHIWRELEAAGYTPREHSFVQRGTTVPNIDVVLPGTSHPDEVILVGAHFDTYQGTPGADDNASGVAATLALARHFAGTPQPRTIRFAFFVNEEPPAFWTGDMGSWVYAKKCRADGDEIVAMLSLESIGYYSDERGSQKYPPPLSLCYPDTGNFIGIVGNVSNRSLVRSCVGRWREQTPFPSQGAALPSLLPGVGWSDHWSFWKEGYPAVMITGTAPFRNPNYHQATDTPETLDYERMARVVDGLDDLVIHLAGGQP
ncbi:MAG TPA: M28 family peptidase [Phycisphaerales bacterium]|nr:M28 family peptidase [Phycisphaerales bacterium]